MERGRSTRSFSERVNNYWKRVKDLVPERTQLEMRKTDYERALDGSKTTKQSKIRRPEPLPDVLWYPVLRSLSDIQKPAGASGLVPRRPSSRRLALRPDV